MHFDQSLYQLSAVNYSIIFSGIKSLYNDMFHNQTNDFIQHTTPLLIVSQLDKGEKSTQHNIIMHQQDFE